MHDHTTHKVIEATAGAISELARRGGIPMHSHAHGMMKAGEVSIPRQSRGLYFWSRSKRLAGSLTRPRSMEPPKGGC